MENKNCSWTGTDSLMIKYHNEEWGIPVHDDNILFELLILEGFQAGLSWKIILHKRENFRKAFDNFNINKIINYTEEKIENLMLNSGIVRNRAKIKATVINAEAFMNVQKEFGSFDKYIWDFTNGLTITNSINTLQDIPTKSDLSDKISIDLQKRGFKFVGSTICYSYLQAIGMVNDHLNSCVYK